MKSICLSKVNGTKFLPWSCAMHRHTEAQPVLLTVPRVLPGSGFTSTAMIRLRL